jgi:hypothetical protein
MRHYCIRVWPEQVPRSSGRARPQLLLTSGWNLFCAAQRCEDLVTDRIVNEFGEGMQAKLEHDFRSVCLHGPDSDSQPDSNFLIRFSFRQKSNYFNLAGSWPGLRMPRRAHLPLRAALQDRILRRSQGLQRRGPDAPSDRTRAW